MTAACAQSNLDSFVESAHLACAAKLQDGVFPYGIDRKRASVVLPQAWNTGDASPPGRGCESDSRAAARPVSARMRTIAFVVSVSSMIVLGFHSSDSRTHDVHAVVTVMCFFVLFQVLVTTPQLILKDASLAGIKVWTMCLRIWL